MALLFVGYELWVTDILAAREQDQLSEEIHEQWADAPTVTRATPAPAEPAPAAPAPRSPRRRSTSVWATRSPCCTSRGSAPTTRGWSSRAPAQVQLAQGPGHYIDTAMPGEQGNFAVAGHRVGRGSPFLDLDQMRPGDPIVVETADAWFVYRVLGDPATGDFGADPSGIPGREIVSPYQVSVIAPTPGGPAGARPPART